MGLAAVSSATVLILARASRRDTGTDVFCNNRISEEMAEAWKNELRLG
jgi:hypothetical protein